MYYSEIYRILKIYGMHVNCKIEPFGIEMSNIFNVNHKI